MSDLIEPVGARLTLLNGPAFRAGLASATESLQAFNDEQERSAELAASSQDAIAAASKKSSATVVDSSATAADAVKAKADATVEASGVIVGASERTAVGVSAANTKIAASSTAAAAETKTAWTSAVATSGKILKYASVIGAAVIYEGVKKYATFNQQVTQLGVNAGISARQLPALAKGFLTISDATGMSAGNVATMAYYLASANPLLKTNNKELLAMVSSAANLNVLAGNSADPTAIARTYGGIVSNQMAISAGSKPLTYSAASGKSINEWINAVTGHGDVTVGGVAGALGTGILPVAKTYGVTLNELGAAYDVLSPAMGATSASTRLKTAIGMLGSNTSKAAEVAELFGGNVTTMASILRSGGNKGLGNLLSYLGTLTTGRVTGKTFATAFYGGGLGSITGGTKGVGTGAGEFLRVLGFTKAQAAVMEGPGGVSAFAKMTPTQLQAAGFAKGTTGPEAELTVSNALIGGAFGAGRTGAAVLQLKNELPTYQTKLAGIESAENPKTYAQALSLAFGEPTVAFNKFKTALENLTINIGKDVTPALESFENTLLKIGSWFGKNKWALDALGAAAGTIVAGAAIVKTVSVVEKLGTGVINIGKYLLTGTTGATSSATALTGAATALNGSAASLKLAADALAGRGGVPGGVTPVGTPGRTTGTAPEDVPFPVLPGARAVATRLGLTAVATWATNTFLDPLIKKHVKSPQHVRSITDTLRGLEIGAGTGWSIGGPIGAVPGAIAGAGLGALYSIGNQNTYSKAIQSYEASHTINARFASQAALGVTATNFAQRAQVLGMSPSTIAGVMAVNAVYKPPPSIGALRSQYASSNIGPQQPAATSPNYDLKSAGEAYTVTAHSLKTAADDQKTAADKTNTSAGTLNTAAEQMLLAAQKWMAGAGLISSALTPGNIHALSVAGTKTSVARK
jgi:hypothetical protein